MIRFIELTKVCTNCGVRKSWGEYHKFKSGRYGTKPTCKKCRAIEKKEYRKNNKEKITISGKKYNRDNKEKLSTKAKNHYIQNKKKILDRGAEYRKNNKEKIIQHRKDYRNQNEEKLKTYHRKYQKDNKYRIEELRRINYNKNKEKLSAQFKENYEQNKEKILKRNKKYRMKPEVKKMNNKRLREKRKTNLKFNLNGRMSIAIGKTLKDGKSGKSWLDLVPYTLKDLIKRLKHTMPESYDWQDYLDGNLHIDHIIPKSVFNFTKPEHEDFKRAWRLSNLQLLPAKENLKKGAKLKKEFQPSLPM